MNFSLRTACTILLLAFVLAACGEDNPVDLGELDETSGPNVPLPGDGSMHATIDGVAWEALITLARNDVVRGDSLITVNGGSGGISVNLSFILTENVNDYAMGENTTNAILNVNGTNWYAGDWTIVDTDASSGSITITSVTADAITGRFEFVAQNPDASQELVAVIDGAFNAPFANLDTLETDGSDRRVSST